jgi:integrase
MKVPKIKLTKTAVDRLPLATSPKERRDYYDADLPNFGVRVSSTSKKYFVMKYVGAKRVRHTIGDARVLAAERAREQATIVLGAMTTGIDPNEQKREAKRAQLEITNSITVAKLIEEYIDKHAKVNKRSWEYDEWLLNQKVVPVWGRRKAQDIRKRDVILLLESLVENKTPAMSNQALKIIRKMFAFAVERDILQTTPFVGVKALAPNVTRERTLTESEIKTLWEALPSCAISGNLQRALKLILITGQRPGEVAGMQSTEIDGTWWTIPAERAKNGLAHRVFLSEMARELIAEQIAATKEKRKIPEGTKYVGFIFPTPHLTKVQSIDSHALAVAVRRNLNWPTTDAKGQSLYTKDGKQATENKFGVDQFTPHDLRRTAATFMSQLGEMDEVIDAVLNHKKQGIIRVYNQNRYDREKQQALESWERKLKAIVTGAGADNVVSITTAKGVRKAA